MFSTILREHTHTAHQALEKTLIPYLKAIRNTQDYLQILKWFYNFYAPLEKEISKNLPANLLLDFNQRRKSVLLLNDIQSLTGISYLPSATSVNVSISGLPQAFGSMYVLEGSTLGGNAICKLILRNLPDANETNLTFFTGYGSETSAMWEKFKLILNTYPFDNKQKQMVISGANETFDNFKQIITQNEEDQFI